MPLLTPWARMITGPAQWHQPRLFPVLLVEGDSTLQMSDLICPFQNPFKENPVSKKFPIFQKADELTRHNDR